MTQQEQGRQDGAAGWLSLSVYKGWGRGTAAAPTPPPKRKEKLANLTLENWPDYAVLTKKQTAKALNLSTATLEPLHQRGEGPERTRLSVRRVGYRIDALRAWLKKRAD